MENWFFKTHFLSHPPGLLSFYTPQEHTKDFGVSLGVVPPGLGVLSILEGCINHCNDTFVLRFPANSLYFSNFIKHLSLSKLPPSILPVYIVFNNKFNFLQTSSRSRKILWLSSKFYEVITEFFEEFTNFTVETFLVLEIPGRFQVYK